MKALVTGAAGQLGSELRAAVPPAVELTALTRDQLDLTDAESVRRAVAAVDPDVIVNAAAYTAVDRAEDEPELARAVNVDGVACLARAAAERRARLLHVSTDFVFDGAQRTPYEPDDATSPVGVYGRTKLDGERAAFEAWSEGTTVVRTSWVYSSFGRNFVKGMLDRLRAGRALRVVWDQVGTPTWAAGLARTLWALAGVETRPRVLHWADAGVASWYDLTVEIAREAGRRGWLPGEPSVEPIRSEEYPTPAARPPYSALEARATRELLDLPARSWMECLSAMMDGLEA